MMYLSNLLKPNHKFIVIFDEAEEERYGKYFMENWLQIHMFGPHGGEKEKHLLRRFPVLGNNLYDWYIWTRFVDELQQFHPINGTKNYYNVLIPTFSEMLYYLSGTKALQFICLLRNQEHVQRICLWVSTAYCSHPNAEFLIASCKHWADLVIHLEDTKCHLTIIQSPRNPGGGVTETIHRHRYRYQKHRKPYDFYLECENISTSNCIQNQNEKNSASTGTTKPSQMTTFKLELEDDEIIAKNALTLPYEKSSMVGGEVNRPIVKLQSMSLSANTRSNIIEDATSIDGGGESRIEYIPDGDDEIEDDPDDDLYI